MLLQSLQNRVVWISDLEWHLVEAVSFVVIVDLLPTIIWFLAIYTGNI